MKKKILLWLGGIILLFVATCLLLYLFQESLIFDARKLHTDHDFQFEVDFDEKYIETKDGMKLHGVLCKADSSAGLIFFLHGTGGNVGWYKDNIPIYTGLNYDIFLLDYRGFGKSEGKITSEEQFYDDVSIVYEYLKSVYREDKIAIIGFSLGGVPAAMLSSKNHPKCLILEGTAYSILEKAKKKLPFLPVSLISRYDFEIKDFIREVSVPIVVFHGDQDKAADLSNSLRLKPYLKPDDKLFILEGEGHGNFINNDKYRTEIKKILK